MIETVTIRDATLYCGDVLEVLPTLAPASIDAFLTDPPFSSGGMFRGDRSKKTSDKYSRLVGAFGEFSGDNKDQRAFTTWAALWASFALDASKPGAVFMGFIDWRQLPAFTDSIQFGGWVWRNLVTWWKPGIRMQRGRFSSSAEYVLYASNGVPAEGKNSPQNVIPIPPVRGEQKTHIAEKPVELLKILLGVCPEGGVVCDPFMGSGSTGEAALLTDRRFIGIEKQREIFDNACARIEAFYSQPDMFRK